MALDKSFFDKADATLAHADNLLATKYRGDFGGRQPIHTCTRLMEQIGRQPHSRKLLQQHHHITLNG
jgi:hypothetical protein